MGIIFALKAAVEASKLLKNVELATRPSNNAYLSLSYVFAIKLRVLVEWATRRIFENPKRGRLLKGLKALENSRKAINALVLANGPSLERLAVEEVKNEVVAGKIEVWGVNYFPLSPLARNLNGKYKLVLSDPGNRPSNTNLQTKKLWEQVLSDESQIFVPVSWASEPLIQSEFGRFTFFDDTSLEGWTKNIKPFRARGYSSLTAYKALALATHFGYREILILGFDNSMYKTLEVSAGNHLLQNPNHAKSTESSVNVDLSAHYRRGVADYFFDASRSFLDLKLMFSKFQIKNLDPSSNVDAFEKKQSSKYLAKEGPKVPK